MSGADGKTPAPEDGTRQNAPQSILGELAKSLAADMSPVADRIAALLDLPEAGMAAAARKLAGELPGLLPGDPEMAAVLEEEIATAFAGAAAADPEEGGMLNANDNRESDGKFAHGGTGDQTGGGKADVGKEGKGKKEGEPRKGKQPWRATAEDVTAFLGGPVADTDVEMVDALLSTGFEVRDGSGNATHFGQRLKDHLEAHTQAESDRRCA